MSVKLFSPPPSGRHVPVPPGTVCVLAEYETIYHLRFAQRVIHVPGVGIFSFDLDENSEAVRLLKKGLPPLSEETRPAYGALVDAYTAKVNSGDVGFSGLLLEQSCSKEVEETLALLAKAMADQLSKRERQKLDAHMVDHQVRGISFSCTLGEGSKTLTSPIIPLSWFPFAESG